MLLAKVIKIGAAEFKSQPTFSKFQDKEGQRNLLLQETKPFRILSPNKKIIEPPLPLNDLQSLQFRQKKDQTWVCRMHWS